MDDDKTPQHEYEYRYCPRCTLVRRMVRVVGDDQWLCTRCLTELKEQKPAHDGSPKERV